MRNKLKPVPRIQRREEIKVTIPSQPPKKKFFNPKKEVYIPTTYYPNAKKV